MHIAIAGNIGSGKTTLAEVLAKHYQWVIQYEDEAYNPYLDDFYKNMERWSFNLQVYFLNKRLTGLLKINQNKQDVVHDRTLYEDACIFAPTLFNMNLMSARDFENYNTLYKHILQLIPPPDLLIYIRASVPTLISQIKKRGRDYEQNIHEEYLTKLNNQYNDWIVSYPHQHLIINVDELNFLTQPENRNEIIKQIDEKLSLKSI